MCGRYSLVAPPADVEQRFGATVAEEFEPRYNAAPRQSLPVVADDAPEVVRPMEWGLVPPWADSRSDAGFINARAETLAQKASFRDAFERDGDVRAGRCLVPADGFYEWVEDESGTKPYRVTLADEELFAMAGLWAAWQPPTAQTGLDAFAGSGAAGPADPDTVLTFTIVTTEPNSTVEPLHHRMAVVLPAGREREWLAAGPEDATELLEPYGGEMRAYRVPESVNDPANDSPAVVEPVE